jgi:hypothetical protein
MSTSQIHIFSVDTGKGRAWAECGWRIFRQDLRHWWMMTALYLLMVLLLQWIPFVGPLILAFFTPILAMGAMATLRLRRIHTQHGAGAVQMTTGGISAKLKAIFIQPAKDLFLFFTLPNRMIDALVLAMLSLGVVIILEITAHLLKGGSFIAAFTAGVGWLQKMEMLVSATIVTLLYFVALLGLIYAVPLMALHQYPPFPAIRLSFQASSKNIMPLSLFCCIALLPLAIAGGFPKIAGDLGYSIQIIVWSVLIPIFLAGCYCSYREVID